MVYNLISFPDSLTEEEENLRLKYAKLRKKRKALQALKTTKPESQVASIPPVKRPSESAEEAMQQVKKLLKSGAIKLEAENKDKQSFKRSKNFEKKLKDPDKTPTSVGFQPFSATHSDTQEEEKELPKQKRKGLYESFVPGERVRESRYDRDDRRNFDFPKKGNTIYVHGLGVTEDLLRKVFSNFGSIVNVTMESDRNCGFVTFENKESSEQAIVEVNGSMISGVRLQVSIARRQLSFENNTDPSAASWASIGLYHMVAIRTREA